jgi:hypothetical protein
LVRTTEPLDLADYTQRVRASRSKKPWVDMPFEHWFVENTYHSDEFKDPDEFVKVKQASGLSISVGLLTFNDARHIHSLITGLKTVLVEMHSIADEIIVVDAGSSDGTADMARSLGVAVYDAAEIMPEHGPLHGPGESWWKSLPVMRSDIVVWLDHRATRFHPSTAMSLAGPLLRVPTLQFVKSFGQPADANQGTRKPLLGGSREDGGFAPVDVSWGGFIVPRREGGIFSGRIRVQALKPEDLDALSAAQFATIPPRTILQALYPSLAGVMSPFGRDMAGRRPAMMSVPVFIGENFEIGLLLSVADKYGMRAIAQVELRHAHPAPPPAPSLQNSLSILNALSRRLSDPAMRRYAAEIAARLEREIEGRGESSEDSPEVFEVRALGPVERPPMEAVIRTDDRVGRD